MGGLFVILNIMFSNPQKNIEQFHLGEGMVVADLGAGSGFYTMEAARAVAPTGKVYAVDIQQGLLLRIKNEASKNKVRNVEILLGDLERVNGTKLREASIDRVIASNILFMIEDQKSFILEIKRILKPGGRVLLVDWSASFGNLGPHPENVVYKDKAMEMFKQAGFVYESEISAGDHHYGIIFKK